MKSLRSMRSSLSIYEALDPEDTYNAILNNTTGGFQMAVLAEMREVLGKILKQKKEEVRSALEGNEKQLSPQSGINRTKIVLAYTSNLISSGLRELFASLVREHYIDSVISTAGGVEEDVIKCLGHTLIGDFSLKGNELRMRGMNRVGNLIIPNDNYVNFETLMIPLITELHKKQIETLWDSRTPALAVTGNEQREKNCVNASSPSILAPTVVIRAMGKFLADEKIQTLINPFYSLEEELCSDVLCEEKRRKLAAKKIVEKSLIYWCAMNDVPVYCPAITDGSIGDIMCFYGFKNKGFVIDPAADYGCLVDLFDDGIRYHSDVTERYDHTVLDDSQLSVSKDNEALHIVVISLGAGLPRNHALTMTPFTGTLLQRDYHQNISHTDHNELSIKAEPCILSSRRIRVRRTLFNIVTGIAVDACRSSAEYEDDIKEAVLVPGDEVYTLHGDATILFPLLLANNI